MMADGAQGHRFHPSILREYDIRGVVGQTLFVEDARAIGRCFATILRAAVSLAGISGAGVVQPNTRASGISQSGAGLQAAQRPCVAVGYDGRLSSRQLEAALVAGLTECGVDVVRIGLGPTPMLYYAEASAKDVQGGIQITGSHNPADHNGFKIVMGGLPFFGVAIKNLGRLAGEGGWLKGGEIGRGGICEDRELLGPYIDRLTAGLDGLTGEARERLATMRIGWDAGNGAAGPAIEALTKRLPGEHHLLFTEVDGHFPNHHPDPTVEANLADLQALVAARRLDFGVAFDGDGDRIGAIDAKGRILSGDQLLMLFAQDLLIDVPGAKIVADIKASQALFDHVAALGGQPVMWKSGHSQIKAKMKEIGAAMGGEVSGHVFFAHKYYGFDDALYGAVRLMAALARDGRSLAQWRDAMPVMVNTPELRFAVDETRKFAVVDEVKARLMAEGADMCDIDGVRVARADGWWLLRASNTQDVLVARAEAADAAGLARLMAQVDSQLAASGLSRGDPVGH